MKFESPAISGWQAAPGVVELRPPMSRHRATLLLYGLTIFAGAALLFLLQLVFARLVLPLLGGAPAVWNTAMVFYQVVLLAGYGYAHLLSSRLPRKVQVVVHGALMALALVFLPFAVPAGWQPPGEGSPLPWLLGLLSVTVGLPFVTDTRGINAGSRCISTCTTFALVTVLTRYTPLKTDGLTL